MSSCKQLRHDSRPRLSLPDLEFQVPLDRPAGPAGLSGVPPSPPHAPPRSAGMNTVANASSMDLNQPPAFVMTRGMYCYSNWSDFNIPAQAI